MNNMQFDAAIKCIMELLHEANAYVDIQAPWKLKKTDSERMKIVLYMVLNIIIKSSIMLLPIIPQSALKALSFFNISKEQISFKDLSLLINNEITLNEPEPLFPRIE